MPSQVASGLIQNPAFGTDVLFIRTKSRVGAQSAQCLPVANGRTSARSSNSSVPACADGVPSARILAGARMKSASVHQRGSWRKTKPNRFDFIQNRVCGTDVLFIRSANTVGAQSAQCQPVKNVWIHPSSSNHTDTKRAEPKCALHPPGRAISSRYTRRRRFRSIRSPSSPGS